jgi:hypothetical protein
MPRVPRLGLVSLALAATMLLAACGGAGGAPTQQAAPPSEPAHSGMSQMSEPEAASIDAAGLRVALGNELREHTYLAASATGQALAGDDDGFNAAAQALDGNTDDIAALVGTVYPDVQESFRELWASHIDMFVRYTQGVASDDQPAADAAVADLTTYADTLAATFEQVTGLPATASQPLIAEHVTSLKSVVDSQKARDFNAVYANLRTAMAHMDMLAGPLAQQIATQQGLPGSVSGQAPDLRAGLNGLLQEHVLLAGSATGQALGGNQAGFEGAAAAIGGNTNDLSAAVGSVYGEETGTAFNGLWASHIDMFVRYAQGVAAGDQAAADAAVNELTSYVGTLASTLEQVTGLSADASTPLITEHVLSLKGAVDAQKAGDFAGAYEQLSEAGAHMQAIADPLAQQIATQQGLL